MRNILENLGRLFIIIIIIAFAINLTSCSKDAIDEMDIPPVVVEPTPPPTPPAPTVTVTSASETVTSTEEIEDVDVNEDGDLLDAIQRLITVTTTTTDTQSNAVTTEGAWEVTLDVNAEATTGTSTETTTEDAIDTDVNQDGDLLDVLIRTITTVATVTGDVTESSSTTTEWTIHEDRTDPMDTAEFTAWSSWTPAQGDGSAPTFTQTRSRECVVTVNGLEDSEAPVCDGDAIQTRNVADSNYVEPSNDFTDEQIASFQATLVSAGYHQWVGDSSGLTYRINEQPHFGNLYIKIRTEDFSLYAWVNSESGIVTVGTAQTVEEAISTMNNFYENGNTAPDEYIVNKGIENVRGETNWKLITNTGAEYCVNYDYWTNVQYTSGGTYSFTEVDQSQVVECYTGEQDGEDADFTPLLNLGFVSSTIPSAYPNATAYFTHPDKSVSILFTPISSVPVYVFWVNGGSTGESFYTIAEAAAYVSDYVADSLPTVDIEVISDKFFYTYVASNGNRVGTSETTFRITGSDAEGPVTLNHSVSSYKVKSWNPDTGILILNGFSLSSSDHFWVYAYDSYGQRAEKKAVFTSLPTQVFYIGLVEQKLIDLMTSYGFAYSSEHAGAYLYNGDETIYVLYNLDSEGRVSNFTFHHGGEHTTWSISSTTNPNDSLDELENQFKSKL